MTDNWTPNRRAYQPKRKGNTDHIVHLINLLCELVDCPECKLCAPMRQRAERLLTEHYGHVSHSRRGPRSARLTHGALACKCTRHRCCRATGSGC